MQISVEPATLAPRDTIEDVPMPPERDDATERIRIIETRVDGFVAQVEEVRIVKKLVGWAIPSIIVATLSFVVTSSVAFYRLSRVEELVTSHVSATATDAHPGTADALWQIRQDVAQTRSTVEGFVRENEREQRASEQRLERIETALEAAAQHRSR